MATYAGSHNLRRSQMVALAPLLFIRLVAPKSQAGFWVMWPLTTCVSFKDVGV